MAIVFVIFIFLLSYGIHPYYGLNLYYDLHSNFSEFYNVHIIPLSFSNVLHSRNVHHTHCEIW